MIAGTHRWLVFYLFPNPAKQRAGTGICVYPPLSCSQSWQGEESSEETGNCCWLLLGLEKKKDWSPTAHLTAAPFTEHEVMSSHLIPSMCFQAWLGWNRCLQHSSVPHPRFTSPLEDQPGANGWEDNCGRLSPGWGWATLQHPWHTLVSSAGLNLCLTKPQRNSHPWGVPPSWGSRGSSKLQPAQEWKVGFVPVQQSQVRQCGMTACGND